MPANPKGAIQLTLRTAATPERVLDAACLFNQILKDAFPRLHDGSITMVVHNLDMVAGIRWQDPAGRRAIDGIIRFIRTPAIEAKKHPQVALALARGFSSEYAEQLTAHQAELRTPRQKLVEFNDDFVARMQEIAKAEKNQPAFRGTTVVYSEVYKVGRSSERARHVTARIDIDGETQEIPLQRGVDNDFFDAAKSRGVHAVFLDAVWMRTADGQLVLDQRRSRLTKVERWQPISGADFMQQVQQIPAEALLDLDDIIDELEAP